MQRAFQFVIAIVNIFVIGASVLRLASRAVPPFSCAVGFSFVPYIDWAAHIGGLVSGALMALWVFRAKLTASKRQVATAWAGLIVYLLLFGGCLWACYATTTPDRALLYI